jgi:hypothetical protein
MYKIKNDFGKDYYLCVDNQNKEIIIPKSSYNNEKKPILKIEKNEIKNKIPEFNILIMGLLLLILVK